MKSGTTYLTRALVVMALIAGAYFAGGVVAPVISPRDVEATTAPYNDLDCYELGNPGTSDCGWSGDLDWCGLCMAYPDDAGTGCAYDFLGPYTTCYSWECTP